MQNDEKNRTRRVELRERKKEKMKKNIDFLHHQVEQKYDFKTGIKTCRKREEREREDKPYILLLSEVFAAASMQEKKMRVALSLLKVYAISKKRAINLNKKLIFLRKVLGIMLWNQ